MTDRELVAERLKFETEVLKLLVLLWLALGGGSLSLVAGGLTGMKLLLASLGLFITVVVILMSIRQYIKIRSIIERAKGGDV